MHFESPVDECRRSVDIHFSRPCMRTRGRLSRLSRYVPDWFVERWMHKFRIILVHHLLVDNPIIFGLLNKAFAKHAKLQ